MDRQTHENSIIEYMLTLLHIADDAPLNTVKRATPSRRAQNCCIWKPRDKSKRLSTRSPADF